jgi:late competence protein required for DNA uptake (superfamily II DNA/RNA helicase)
MIITEDKRIIIRLSNIKTAETISGQLREKIIKRITEGVDATSANRQIVAVRKLRSEDLAIFIDSPAAKKKIKSAIN